MFRITTWILVLLFSSAIICQGKDGASFTECRVHIEAALNQYAANVEETPSTVDESAEVTAPSEDATVSIEATADASSEEAGSGEVSTEEPPVSEGSSEEGPPAEEAESVDSEQASTEETSGEAPTDEASSSETPATEEASSSEAPATEEASSSDAPSTEAASDEGTIVEEALEEASAAEEVSGEETATETSAEPPAEDTSEEAGAEVPVTEETSEESTHEEGLATETPVSETSGESSEEASGDVPAVEETPSEDAASEEVSAQESSTEESSADGPASAEEPSEEATESPAAEEPGSTETSEEAAEPAPETEAASSEEASAEESGEDKSSEESSEVDVGSPSSGEVDASSGQVESDKSIEEEEDEEAASSEDALEGEAEEPELDAAEEVEPPPAHLRPRDHVDRLLGVDESSTEINEVVQRVARTSLKELKRVYDSSVKPLEAVYKYKDISTRHLGDPELYSKSMILMMGPWGSGKSTFANYLLGNEYTKMALKTGSQPGSGFFNIIEFGESDASLDGTELVAQWEFSSLQKFGQAFLQRLQGHRMPNRLLEKVTLVDMPGIVERGKQLERDYPFNDVCQWFIDRSDLILVMFDPTRLDAGLEMEALFDQLKGREPQVRIVLNKADMVRPQDLMRVQGNLFWALSPLLGSSEPPVIYAGSFWSRLYRPGAPIRLFRAQEEALLLDIRDAFESRVENRIALTRRHAVRVRNHAKMVDCYLNTFYSQKSFFGNKKKVAGEIVENPGEYRIYEGISTLTNVSRYDLPDPDIYKDFFRLHPLYDFPTLHSTCTFFRGCPLDKLDIAISYDLPELLGKHRKSLEQAIVRVHAGRGQ